MAITALESDLGIIAALPDEPNDVGGLSAAALKAKFDEAGNTIKTYVNETLIPRLDGTNLPLEYGAEGGQTIRQAIEEATVGALPDGSITAAKLAPGVAEAMIGDLQDQLSELTENVDTGLASKANKTLEGAAAPTAATVGSVGQLYLDTAQARLYKCIAVNGSVYTWDVIEVEQIGDMRISTKSSLGSKYLVSNGALIRLKDYPDLYYAMSAAKQFSSLTVGNTGSSVYCSKVNGYYVIVHDYSNPLTLKFALNPAGPWTAATVAVCSGVLSNVIWDGSYYSFFGEYYNSNTENTEYYLYYCATLGGTWLKATSNYRYGPIWYAYINNIRFMSCSGYVYKNTNKAPDVSFSYVKSGTGAYNIAFDGTTWVMPSGGTVWYSTDLSTWNSLALASITAFSMASKCGQYWVVVGAAGSSAGAIRYYAYTKDFGSAWNYKVCGNNTGTPIGSMNYLNGWYYLIALYGGTTLYSTQDLSNDPVVRTFSNATTSCYNFTDAVDGDDIWLAVYSNTSPYYLYVWYSKTGDGDAKALPSTSFAGCTVFIRAQI